MVNFLSYHKLITTRYGMVKRGPQLSLALGSPSRFYRPWFPNKQAIGDACKFLLTVTSKQLYGQSYFIVSLRVALHHNTTDVL